MNDEDNHLNDNKEAAVAVCNVMVDAHTTTDLI